MKGQIYLFIILLGNNDILDLFTLLCMYMVNLHIVNIRYLIDLKKIYKKI